VIPVLERSPQRRRDRPGASTNFDHTPVRVVPHDDPTRVARQTLRRSRGNAHAVLEDRLSEAIRIREDRGVDVDHDLIALAGRARIDPVMQRRLRDERQGVRTLLLHGGHVMRRLRRARPGAAPTSGASRPRITTMPSSS